LRIYSIILFETRVYDLLLSDLIAWVRYCHYPRYGTYAWGNTQIRYFKC